MRRSGHYGRSSPVKFAIRPVKTEMRDGWEVVLAYRGESEGPFLMDLSHVPKWDVQDADLTHIRPMDVAIPERTGDCILENGLLINRMNATQAAIWHLLEAHPAIPQEFAYTDVSEAYALMAVLGKDVHSMMEKVTSLDLYSRAMRPPFLLQGPVLRIPSQIVVLGHKIAASAVLIACPRGYAQSMSEAFLDACTEWGLRPAGETAFRNWLKQG